MQHCFLRAAVLNTFLFADKLCWSFSIQYVCFGQPSYTVCGYNLWEHTKFLFWALNVQFRCFYFFFFCNYFSLFNHFQSHIYSGHHGIPLLDLKLILKNEHLLKFCTWLSRAV